MEQFAVKSNFNTSYVTVQLVGLASKFNISRHFNTSYVTVQRYLINNNFLGLPKFQYILCYGSTLSAYLCDVEVSEFQYILCYGSTNMEKEFENLYQHFNTSYVAVQLFLVVRVGTRLSDFNTSYVAVQLSIPASKID